MKKDITIIITLYRTPLKRLKDLNQYKNYKVIIFAQDSDKNYKNIIKKNSIIKFEYYFSSNNIGLPKATNYLISKVKTKYFLFTQADILINEKSIQYLKNAFKYNDKIIFSGPSFKNKRGKGFKMKNSLNAACMLCDTNKTKKIGFFDEDFFLYWEDVFLMRKVNRSKFKMVLCKKAIAKHSSGASSINNTKVQFIRNLNFKYGEYLYDFKIKKFRLIKLIRQFLQSSIYLILSSLSLNKNFVIKNIAYIFGITKFIIYYLRK